VLQNSIKALFKSVLDRNLSTMTTSDAKSHEPHPDPQKLTGSITTGNSSYIPDPSQSISISPRRQNILKSICALYSGSASEEDMQIYAEDAIYDDPLSYCDSRYKIAGQWYGIPKLFAKSTTLATQVVKSSNVSDGGDLKSELVFKLRQEYVLIGTGEKGSKQVDSLVSLGLEGKDGEELVKYHKDMWNEKDYSHQGIGFLIKKLNGDYLTGVTQPPKGL
jgi:hypothetical protein